MHLWTKIAIESLIDLNPHPPPSMLMLEREEGAEVDCPQDTVISK